MKFNYFIFSLPIIVLFSVLKTAAYAEDRLDFPVLTFHSGYSNQGPSNHSSSMITRENLVLDKTVDINAHLYRLPSVVLTQGKTSGITGISLRGTSGGQGLVTFDGVPLFAGFAGFYSMRLFPSEVLHEVAVNRGFDQSISASRTLGGAIHLRSRRLTDEKTHLQLEVGSQTSVNGSLATGLGDEKQNISTVFGYQHIANGDTQSGIASTEADKDNYQLGRALLRADKTFDQGHIDASVYYTNIQEETDGPGFTKDFKVAWMEDPNGWYSEQLWVAQVKGSLDINPYWQSQFQLAYTGDFQDGELGTLPSFIQEGPFSMQLSSELIQADWQNHHHANLSKQLSTNIQWGLLTQYQQAEARATNQQESELLLSPNLVLGLAYKDWQIQLKSQWDHYQKYGDHLTYTLGTEWAVLPSLSLWANTGTHFRAPGVNERLHPLFGNLELKPESNFGAEAGINWNYQDTEMALSGYWQGANDLIVLALNAETGASQANNITQTETFGIDFNVKQAWFSFWNSELTYSYMHAINTQNQQTLAARPEHRVSLKNDWQIFDPLHLQFVVNANSGLWFDSSNTLWSGAVVRLNAFLSYQVQDNLEFYLRAENLSNDTHTELAGFNYPHRAFYFGTKFDF